MTRKAIAAGLMATAAAMALAAPAMGAVGPKTRGKVGISASAPYVGDKQLARLLLRGGAWCRWNGNEVEMSLTLLNKAAAHVTAHVETGYTLRNAGTHGNGVGDWQDLGIDAGAKRTWTGKLGHPAGVKGHPRITSCTPEIQYVEAG